MAGMKAVGVGGRGVSKGSVSEGKVPGFWFRQLEEHSSDEVYSSKGSEG